MGKESYEVVSLKDIFAFMGCILQQNPPFVNSKKRMRYLREIGKSYYARLTNQACMEYNTEK